MGKVEDMRALRAQIRAGLERTRPDVAHLKQAAKGGKGVKGLRPAVVITDELAGEPELCGHTAIGGKRCIRPKDHAEKNHRYAKG